MKQIVITDLRTEEMRDMREYLAGQGFEVLSVPEGIRLWDEEGLRGFADSLTDPCCVIHPAPPAFQCGLEAADEELFARSRDEGPIAAWCVTKVFAGLFRERKSGTLIFVNSIHAEKPMGYGTLFSAGCGAVQMLNREISQDYGTAGVRSFFIQRGPGRDDPDLRNDLTSLYFGVELRYPSRRLPERGSLNQLVSFLLTPGADLLIGSDLRADGGMTMYYGERSDEPLPLKGSSLRRGEEGVPPPPEKERRVALVTGSGKGVGAGIVRVLARAGIRCVINCHSNPAMAEETLREVQAQGGEAFVCQADVSDPKQCGRMVQETLDRYGRLDILVNNAAMQYNKFIDEYDTDLLRYLWNVNLGGYWRMIRFALPALRKSPSPRIINIGSVHGKRPTNFDPGYAMTKGAIRMLTREAALELQPEGITVNSLSLGGTKIEFKTGNARLYSRRPRAVLNPDSRSRIHMVMPEEVGDAVLWLCGPKAGAVTGGCIRIDGGQSLNG